MLLRSEIDFFSPFVFVSFSLSNMHSGQKGQQTLIMIFFFSEIIKIDFFYYHNNYNGSYPFSQQAIVYGT